MTSTAESRSSSQAFADRAWEVREAKALAALNKAAPEICRQILEQKRFDQRHKRRHEWANLIAQALRQLSGLVALGILATVAWHAIDSGAATQAAAIICTGAASTVVVFVTGRRGSDSVGDSRSMLASALSGDDAGSADFNPEDS